MNPLVTLAIEETPMIIAYLQTLFTIKNPGVPPPTSDQLVAAYLQAFGSSMAKDEAWLAAHPA